MSTSSPLCACGRPLHYSSDELLVFMLVQIGCNGETVDVTTPQGTWRVHRHYIALHGLKAIELPSLAERYGWPKVSAEPNG